MEEQDQNNDAVEDESEVITNSINDDHDQDDDGDDDDEIHTEIDIKDEPIWVEGTATQANPEPEEPVAESEVQDEIKFQGEAEDVHVPETPPKRDRTTRAFRLLETHSSIRRMRKKLQWRQEYHNAMMELRAQQHEIEMERLTMDTDVLKKQLQHQKKINEFKEQRLKIEKEILEQRALRLDLLKNKVE